MVQLPSDYEGMRSLAIRAITIAIGGDESASLYHDHKVKGIPMRTLARDRKLDRGTIYRRLVAAEKTIEAITHQT